jgi:translation initiation factor IF-1
MMTMKTKRPEGTITEALPGQIYRVEMIPETMDQETTETLARIQDQKQPGTILAYVAGKMRRARIQLLVGDRVEMVLDPAGGKTTNRIVWRK